MTIRILRVLEYEYEAHGQRDAARVMADDVANWGIGATQTVKHGGVRISSSTHLPQVIPDRSGPGPDVWFEAIEAPRLGEENPDYIAGDLRFRNEDQ